MSVAVLESSDTLLVHPIDSADKQSTQKTKKDFFGAVFLMKNIIIGS